MPLPSVRQALDRDAAIDWYLRNRARSHGLFNLLTPDAYYTRPIALRNPVVFYEGHLPAFSVIALIKRGLGRPGVDERLETLFARGIDPQDERCGRRRVQRKRRVAVARRGTGLRTPCRRSHPRSAADLAARLDRPTRDASARGRLRRAGTRADAPGDADVHVASASLRAEARARRIPAFRRRQSAAAGNRARPVGRGNAGRRSASRSVLVGQRISAAARSKCRRSTSTCFR